MVHVEVLGDEALAAKFMAAAAELEREKPYWLRDVADILEESIQGSIAAQGLIDTGDLIDSGRIFYQTANGISVGFGRGLDYAEPLELGAAAHEIVGNPYLAFKWSGGQAIGGYYGWHHSSGDGPGEDVVVTRVNHPGNPAYRFVYNGTMMAFTPILMYFNARLRAIFGGM